KKHPLGEKRNHPGSKLRQGFWMVFRFGVNNWGLTKSLEAIRFQSYFFTIGFEPSTQITKPKML
ncbi:hypothetical protein, partial [Streptococcus pneumoniae]|uniref:hypothetical protein n=2 Tax=Streptococcus pneumoniae TaxID=1313 RepID=UPI001E4CC745